MLDVGEIISITEAFVIVSANNTRQVRTIVEEVELAIKVLGGDEDEGPRSVEGLQDASWVLMDYGDIIVHVFLAETRAYYDLERLWADAPRLEWDTEPIARSGAPLRSEIRPHRHVERARGRPSARVRRGSARVAASRGSS